MSSPSWSSNVNLSKRLEGIHTFNSRLITREIERGMSDPFILLYMILTTFCMFFEYMIIYCLCFYSFIINHFLLIVVLIRGFSRSCSIFVFVPIPDEGVCMDIHGEKSYPIFILSLRNFNIIYNITYYCNHYNVLLKVKSSMARSLPVEKLPPQNVGSIINYLQYCTEAAQ